MALMGVDTSFTFIKNVFKSLEAVCGRLKCNQEPSNTVKLFKCLEEHGKKEQNHKSLSFSRLYYGQYTFSISL